MNYDFLIYNEFRNHYSILILVIEIINQWKFISLCIVICKQFHVVIFLLNTMCNKWHFSDSCQVIWLQKIPKRQPFYQSREPRGRKMAAMTSRLASPRRCIDVIVSRRIRCRLLSAACRSLSVADGRRCARRVRLVVLSRFYFIKCTAIVF